MAHYIDKDALVAEIEILRNKVDLSSRHGEGLSDAYYAVSKILDTIEVKEVDFDAEWKRYFEHRGEMATVNVKHLAKHFFELGMAVSNVT